MTKDDLKLMQPGDIGLCRNLGGKWTAISTFEWMRIPQEALEYAHVIMFLDSVSLFEMTWPKSQLTPIAEYDLSRVDPWRLNFPGTANPLFPPSKLTQFALEDAVFDRIGLPYRWQRILRFWAYGMPARLGCPSLSRKLLEGNAEAGEVCSTAVEDVATEAARKIWGNPTLDLLPQFGHGMVMPSTWPLSPYMRRVC